MYKMRWGVDVLYRNGGIHLIFFYPFSHSNMTWSRPYSTRKRSKKLWSKLNWIYVTNTSLELFRRISITMFLMIVVDFVSFWLLYHNFLIFLFVFCAHKKNLHVVLERFLRSTQTWGRKERATQSQGKHSIWWCPRCYG